MVVKHCHRIKTGRKKEKQEDDNNKAGEKGS